MGSRHIEQGSVGGLGFGVGAGAFLAGFCGVAGAARPFFFPATRGFFFDDLSAGGTGGALLGSSASTARIRALMGFISAFLSSSAALQ